MTAPALRPYQGRAVTDALAALDGRPVLVLPTGAGKTVVAAEIVRRYGPPALFVVHRREIVLQAARAFAAAGMPAGVVMAGVEPTPGAPVQVAAIQTLVRREWPAARLLVVDEAHHAAPGSRYADLFAAYPRVLGLTATPWRLDGTGLGAVGFGTIVVGATVRELCAAGYLVEPEVYAPASPDLDGVGVVAGDFNKAQLAGAMSMREIVGGIVEKWKEVAAGRRTVAFAVSVEHSVEICRRFAAAGVYAEHVDASTPKDERDAMLARLAAGRTQVLCNVGILSEGWDLPALEVAILARPTLSSCLHRQQIGRIMRAADGKLGATVLDHAGNTLRHGRVTDDVDVTLAGFAARPADTKVCPKCSLVVVAGENPCPGCGYVWPAGAAGPREVEEVAGTLTKGGRVVAAPFVDRAAYFAAVRNSRLRAGAPEPKAVAAASGAHNSRFGFWPCVVGDRIVDPANATDAEWDALREGWANRMRAKGKPATVVAWFVRKCEAEARGRAV